MGLEIGTEGIRILGGGFGFAFDVGTIGVAGAANFGPDLNVPGGYVVSMDAAVTTPDMTLNGYVTIAVLQDTVELRKIAVSIEGTPPNAPTVLLEPITELYLYRVSGEMELTQARQAISVSAAAESLYRVGPISLLGADATLTGEWHPDHYILLEGQGFLLEQQVASATLRIQPEAVVFSGTTGINSQDEIVVEQNFSAAIGTDSEGEPTMLAGAKARLFVASGAIFPAVPPCDVEGEADGTIGRHLHDGQKLWGARVTGEVDVCFFSQKGWVWVGFSPFVVDGGFGDESDTYTPIWPAAQLQTTASGQYLDPRILASFSSPTGISYPAVEVRSQNGQFVAGPATSLLAIEYLPDGVDFDALPLQLTPPDGATFAPAVDHTSAEFRTRYYVLDAPQEGLWQVEAPSGAFVAILGSDPLPVIEEASIISPSAPYSFTWRVSDDDPLTHAAISLQARRIDEPGQTVPFAEGLEAAGQASWTPTRLASGEYAVELVVDTGLQTIVHQIGSVIWQDTVPPAAPVNLHAAVPADGSLLLDWQPADEDTAGYRIQVADGITQTPWSRYRAKYRTVGFNPGDTVTARVAAVDLSDNVSPWAEKEVIISEPDVAVQSWSPYAGATHVPGNTYSVTVSFQQPLTVTNFTVTGPDGLLPGEWTPRILAEEALAPLTIGASWQQVNTTCAPNPPGSYTAQVTGMTVAGEPVTISWDWSVADTDLHQSGVNFPGCRMLLPVIRR
jgi:hypothetical protein